MSSRSIEPSATEAATLAAHWLAAWAEATPQAFGACCAVAVSYEDPILREPIEGLDALAGHAHALRRTFPDMRLEPLGEPLAERGFGCLPWRLLGTQRGEAGGLPASGRFVTVHGVHYVELKDGLVLRARGFFDLYGAATQMGILPARGSLSESAVLMLRGFGLLRPRG